MGYICEEQIDFLCTACVRRRLRLTPRRELCSMPKCRMPSQQGLFKCACVCVCVCPYVCVPYTGVQKCLNDPVVTA